MAAARAFRGVLFAVVVCFFFLLPVVVGEGGVQARLDAAQPGETVRLDAGVAAEQLRIDRGVSLVGVGPDSVLDGGGAGAVVRLAGDAAARFLRLRNADVGVHVEAGQRGFVGPVVFDQVRIAIQVDAGGSLFLRNDPTVPMRTDIASDGRVYFTTPKMVDVVDAATGRAVDGVELELLTADGAGVLKFGPAARGPVEMDLPTDRLGPDEDVVPIEEGWRVRVLAPGYVALELPREDLNQAQPIQVRVERVASAPGTVVPLEATADAEVRQQPPVSLSPAVVAGAIAASGVVAAGMAAWVWGSERRWLRWLAFVAPLYTRLRKRELLEQPTRERIHGHISANPGIRYRALQRDLALPNGVLAHHVQILLRESLLVETRIGQAVSFHVPGDAPDLADAGSRILAFLRTAPGATGRDVSEATGISASLTSYHLQRLADAGALRRERDGNRVRAYLADDAERGL